MTVVTFNEGELDQQLQNLVNQGFEKHSDDLSAPAYQKKSVNWVLSDSNGECIAVLTADLLWDWLYIDELWVADSCRGLGYGKLLLEKAEDYARDEELSGLWLWTQSWQAPKLYERMGYVEFTRFENFPKGHSRIGLRKVLNC